MDKSGLNGVHGGDGAEADSPGAEADSPRDYKADGETIASAVKHEEEVSCGPLSGTEVANVSEDTESIKRERKSYRA
jgi:hypothetical protein